MNDEPNGECVSAQPLLTEGESTVALENALTLAALAAEAWSNRSRLGADQPRGEVLLKRLMEATAWATRARRVSGEGPISVNELLDALSRPVATWLPEGPADPLLEGDAPTPLCEDLADEAGSEPGAEIEQRVMLRVMAHLGGFPDGAEKYAAFRRFLVDHGWASEAEAVDVAIEIGLRPFELYERVSPECTLAMRGEDHFYPCPRCAWPMRRSRDSVMCRAETCRREGARFMLTDTGELNPLGHLTAPNALSSSGRCRLRFGLWRYTLLPGLLERDLAQRLEAIPDTAVTLWPELDAYDLDVRRGPRRWRVDVKDHASARSLARHLHSKPVATETHIVVPDYRRHQLTTLETLCRDLGSLRFHAASGFVRRVKSAGGTE